MSTLAGPGLLLLPLRRCFLRKHQRLSAIRPLCCYEIRAVASTAASTAASTEPEIGKIGNGEVDPSLHSLACPICYYPLNCKGGRSLTDLECRTCKKSYSNNEVYLDLTIASGSVEFSEVMPAGTELFRSPLVSFLYERGWRQNFVWGGFPGPDKEFEMAKGYLKPTFGAIIVDASCGSGLFSRMFSSSGLYSLVIALDFSENMLRQCSDFIKQEGVSRDNLLLVRADISRLPFISSSVDAVHAGAALHCWPSPSTAVAEISRILKPGGVFVATTFIADGIYSRLPFFNAARQFISSVTGQRPYLSEGDLEDLCRACGLIGFTCVRNGPFVMMSATKPKPS